MSNSWSNTSITELVIPTGATTGQRIEINVGQSGDIETFRSDGTLGTKIGGPNAAVISYPTGHTLAAALVDGGLSLGSPDSFTGAARVEGNLFFGGSIELNTGTGDATHLDAADLLMTAGQDSQATGSATAPNALLLDSNGTSAVDFLLSGSLVKAGLSGTPATWQTPSYAANWAGTGAFSGLGGDALKFHLMPDDTLWLQGLVIASTGAGTTIFTLPAGYRPVSGTPHGQVAHLTTAGGIPTLAEVAITTAGLVIVSAGIANGDTFSFNFRIPLHNVA